MVQGRERYIGTFTWAAGLVGKYDWMAEKLPKKTWIKRIHCRLAGSLTTGATVPTRVEDSPMSLLREITIQGGGFSFIQVTPARKYIRCALFYGTPLERQNIGVAASTAYPFACHIIFDGAWTRYQDGVLVPPVFDDLKIGLNWGTYSDLYSAQAPTSWTTTPTLDVYVEEDDVGADPKTLPLIKEWEKEVVVSVVGAQPLDFPKGNMVLDAMLYAVDNSVRSDSLITKLGVKSRNPTEDLAEETAWAWLQDRDKQRYMNDPIFEADGSTWNLRTYKGFAMLDYLKQGGLQMVGREQVTVNATSIAPTGTARFGMLVRELLPAKG